MLGQAVGQAFRLTLRLWIALAIVWVAQAAMASLALSVLPLQVVTTPEGQTSVTVPTAQNLPQLTQMAVGTLAAGFINLIISMLLLAGIVGELKRLLIPEPTSALTFIKSGLRWFFPVSIWFFWVIVFVTVVSVGLGLTGALPQGIAGAPNQPPVSLAGALGLAITLVLGVPFVGYSLVIRVDRAQGIFASLRDAAVFLFRNFFPTLGLLALVIGVFGLSRLVMIPLGGQTNPFSRNFIQVLLVGLPQAYVTVFFPSLFYAYVHARTHSGGS